MIVYDDNGNSKFFLTAIPFTLSEALMGGMWGAVIGIFFSFTSVAG